MHRVARRRRGTQPHIRQRNDADAGALGQVEAAAMAPAPSGGSALAVAAVADGTNATSAQQVGAVTGLEEVTVASRWSKDGKTCRLPVVYKCARAGAPLWPRAPGARALGAPAGTRHAYAETKGMPALLRAVGRASRSSPGSSSPKPNPHPGSSSHAGSMAARLTPRLPPCMPWR